MRPEIPTDLWIRTEFFRRSTTRPELAEQGPSRGVLRGRGYATEGFVGTAIPEPASFVLMGMGMVAVGLLGRNRLQAKRCGTDPPPLMNLFDATRAEFFENLSDFRTEHVEHSQFGRRKGVPIAPV